jgi:hypothetical protein
MKKQQCRGVSTVESVSTHTTRLCHYAHKYPCQNYLYVLFFFFARVFFSVYIHWWDVLDVLLVFKR